MTSTDNVAMCWCRQCHAQLWGKLNDAILVCPECGGTTFVVGRKDEVEDAKSCIEGHRRREGN